MTYHYLYRIKNIENDKIYLGIHSTKNMDDGYFGSGDALKDAIAKYGKDKFVKENLEFFDTRQELEAREEELVDDVFVDRHDTYNLIKGGAVGRKRYGVLQQNNTSNHHNISKYTRNIKGRTYNYWRVKIGFHGNTVERLFPYSPCGLRRAVEARDAIATNIEKLA